MAETLGTRAVIDWLNGRAKGFDEAGDRSAPTAPGSTDEPFVVTRGCMDPQNRRSALKTMPVREGRPYTFRWTLEPKDHGFPAEHRIGLVVFSSDQDYTLLPVGGTRLTVTPRASEVTLPIVGGRKALDW
jgi:X-Pro dipeptidyl-peptidase